MSRKLVYDHVDVFTDKPFGGNQLAVFHAPGSITKQQMQLVAREINFSESTFVFPARASGVAAKVRIFTPVEEIPFAGHPVIGTAFVLRRRTKKKKKPQRLVLEIGAGPVTVELVKEGRGWTRFVMNQPQPVFGSALQNRGEAAAAVGINSFEVVGGGVVSNGLDFLIVEARESEVVARAALNMEEAARVVNRHKVAGIYLFSRVEGKTIAVHARFFAPHMGVNEDPATGSAAGALGGYLARILKFPPRIELKIDQGREIGRKSLLSVEVGCDRGLVQSVNVSGSVVMMGEGAIML